VKEQSAAFVEKAQSLLGKAQALLEVLNWPEDARRATYFAGLYTGPVAQPAPS
jgi:hypothetical protein